MGEYSIGGRKCSFYSFKSSSYLRLTWGPVSQLRRTGESTSGFLERRQQHPLQPRPPHQQQQLLQQQPPQLQLHQSQPISLMSSRTLFGEPQPLQPPQQRPQPPRQQQPLLQQPQLLRIQL